MWRFLTEAHAGTFEFARWPALQRHSDSCEALPAFRHAYLPFFVSA
jgi:glutathione S-transferase